MWSWMSFLTPSVIQVNPNIFLDYDFVEFLSRNLLLDSISPILNYDMDRYLDEIFIESHSFFTSNSNYYNDYLHNYIIKLGHTINLSEKEAYDHILYSSLKKIFIWDYSDNQLDSLDYFVLDWAKNNYSEDEIADLRNLILENHEQIKVYIY